MQKMVDSRWRLWLSFLGFFGLAVLSTDAFNVGITYVENAVAKGAGVWLILI